jgi:CBS domain containing-hemolysin-like protein
VLLFIYFSLAVGVSFLCSVLEAVLLSITPAYIESIKRSNPHSARLLEAHKKDIDSSIASILTLNTFAHTLGAAGVGAEAVYIFGSEYMFYISAILTLIILIFSEIIPKTIGAYYWRELSGFSARVIYVLILITKPLLALMKHITNLIVDPKSCSKSITKEEIYATASMGKDAGVIRQKETGVIENILELDKIKVKDIYTPRSVVFTLSYDDIIYALKSKDLSKIDKDRLREYSRIPIYGKSIDDIKGIILTKEFFYEFTCSEENSKLNVVKKVFKVHQNLPVSKLMDLFLSKKEHIFVVVDGYKQVLGIVTLEDALETLLGVEIVDELDKNIDMREVAKIKSHRSDDILY